MSQTNVWVKTCLVAGTLLIGAYVLFGATPNSRKKRKKKDVIPGLANIGNSCFLNALVQSLASCPLFMMWLTSKHTQAAPLLLSKLHSLLKVLNNEGGTGGDACAGGVLGALRGHGWVITSEEQDTHELFHVLTSTIEDEILSGAPVPSLLDVTWLDGSGRRQEGSTGKGVALRATLWRLNNMNTSTGTSVEGSDVVTGSNVSTKEMVNGVLCSHVVKDMMQLALEVAEEGDNATAPNNDHKCGSGGVSDNEERTSEETHNGFAGVAKTDEGLCNGEETPGCDNANSNKDDGGCSASVLGSKSNTNCSSINGKHEHKHDGHITNRLSSSRNSTKGNTRPITNTKKLFKGASEANNMKVFAVLSESIGKRNMPPPPHPPLHKPAKNHTPPQPPPPLLPMLLANHSWTHRRTCTGHQQQDIPFRGYLASQLQCTICGHKNPVQWSSFESLSLSLPSLPLGEVGLEELLETYITKEQVSEVSCDSCTRLAAIPTKTTFTKQLTIGKLPDCLCFHLKRTVWLENGSAIKRTDHVTFPEFLVMDPYTYTTSIITQDRKKAGGQSTVLSEGDSSSKNSSSSLLDRHNISRSTALIQYSTTSVTASSSLLYGGGGSVQCDQMYRLQAVIVHVGDVFCGHFVTYRRGPAGSRSKNRWFYASDLLVREASLEEVRKANAYMILYEKVM